MPDIEKLRDELYQRMHEEQNRWRDWLVGQSALEILDHACEYTAREDILMEIKDLELSEEQVKALSRSPCPLADIYDDYKDCEIDHMDTIRDIIERRAGIEIRKAQEHSQRNEGR